MTKKINESLRKLDLIHMVRPVITLDEFEAKFGGNALVVAFRTTDEDAAYDLSRFIEFGAVDVLDTEVSPAPDEDNFYVVFVEIERHKIAEKIYEMLVQCSYLTDISEWTYLAWGKKAKINIK